MAKSIKAVFQRNWATSHLKHFRPIPHRCNSDLAVSELQHLHQTSGWPYRWYIPQHKTACKEEANAGGGLATHLSKLSSAFVINPNSQLSISSPSFGGETAILCGSGFFPLPHLARLDFNPFLCQTVRIPARAPTAAASTGSCRQVRAGRAAPAFAHAQPWGLGIAFKEKSIYRKQPDPGILPWKMHNAFFFFFPTHL